MKALVHRAGRFRPAAIVLAIIFAAAARDQDEPRSIRAGAFTQAQAERGQKAFQSQCARCHEPDRFTGAFLEPWVGETALALYTVVRTTMPEDNPNSLRPQLVADVLAYLFSLNRYPAGDVELPATESGLKAVRIEAPNQPIQP
jgi:mono/diheme cytochrome c family protein